MASNLPLVELHCHLDGIVDPVMLEQLQTNGQRLPLSVRTLLETYPVDSHEKFEIWHRVVSVMEGNLENYKPILALHAERLRNENVAYAEIMISSSDIPRDRDELVPRMKDFRAFADSLELGTLQLEFLVCFSRTSMIERVEELADRLEILARSKLVCGVAVAGNEVGAPVRPFRHALARVREAGLKIEVHAGETAGAESIREALDFVKPDRIGGSVRVFDDKELVARLKDQQIHLEMYPTANVCTRTVDRLEEHPLKKARLSGLSISINTDEPGAFTCSMASEYGLLSDVFGYTLADVERVKRDALEARFRRELRVTIPGIAMSDRFKKDESQDSLDIASQLGLPSLEATPAERQIFGVADGMQLRELLNARNELSRIINRKYKHTLALCFCDIVGSTSYMARFGDEAGQAIMQRLMILVAKALPVTGGTLVETTGDGVFLTWTSVQNAVVSLIELRKLIDQDNLDIPGEQRLAVRIGVHWGTVLADGDLVTGENVNLTARVTGLADDGQIVMTRLAYNELAAHARMPGRSLPPKVLKGIPVPIETLVLEWRDPHLFPRRVRVLETGDEYELPDRDNLTFGRTAASETETENDVVLTHPDVAVRQKVSRRQFSLHRHPEGWLLRLLSDRPVEVNGESIQRGMEAQVKSGAVVRIAGVLSLMFLSMTTSTKLEDPNRTVV